MIQSGLIGFTAEDEPAQPHVQECPVFTSLRGPSFMRFWIYDLYPLLDFTPACLVEPLKSQGYTDPEMSSPVIMYTSARVGDIGP
jgi:hypothetical protein